MQTQQEATKFTYHAATEILFKDQYATDTLQSLPYEKDNKQLKTINPKHDN